MMMNNLCSIEDLLDELGYQSPDPKGMRDDPAPYDPKVHVIAASAFDALMEQFGHWQFSFGVDTVRSKDWPNFVRIIEDAIIAGQSLAPIKPTTNNLDN